MCYLQGEKIVFGEDVFSKETFNIILLWKESPVSEGFVLLFLSSMTFCCIKHIGISKLLGTKNKK